MGIIIFCFFICIFCCGCKLILFIYLCFHLQNQLTVADLEFKFIVDREIEKLKLSELSCPQGVIEVAKM